MRRILIAVLCGGVCACSDRPSDGDARSALSSHLDGGQPTRLEIATLSKTDGQSAEIGGVKGYTMSFTATVRFAQDAFWLRGDESGLSGTTSSSLHTFASSARHPGCPNDQSCFILGPSPTRARQGDLVNLSGTMTFDKTERGWRSGHVSFETTLAAQAEGAPSASRPTVATAAVGVSADRCGQYVAAHPLPRAPLFDRLRGRARSVAKELPDSPIQLTNATSVQMNTPDHLGLTSREGQVGHIAYLNTGEICIGNSPLVVASDIWKDSQGYWVSLSRPSAQGYRTLMLLDVDKGVFYSWVVHPDSTTALSGDLLADFHNGPMIITRPPIPANWSPDGKYLALDVPLGNSGVPGFLTASIPNGPTRMVNFLDILPKGNRECIQMATDEKALKWTASDVVQTRIYLYLYTGGRDSVAVAASCPMPWETSANVAVDLARGTLSRVR